MKKAWILSLLHHEEGVENTIAVFSNKILLEEFRKNLEIEYGKQLIENEDYIAYDVPFYN